MTLRTKRVALVAVLLACSVGCYVLSRTKWVNEMRYIITSISTIASSDTWKHNREKTDGRRLQLAEVKKKMNNSQHFNGGSRVDFLRDPTDKLALRISFRKENMAPGLDVSGEAATQGDVVMTFNTSGLRRNGGLAFFNKSIESGKSWDFRHVAEYPVVDEHLTEMELEILAEEPVKDLTTIASPNTSRLELVGLNNGTKVRVGDKVNVRVILKDAKGRPVTKGGHFVRVWMVGRENITRSAAVDVTDLRNGIYEASLPILWPGPIEVQAALHITREFRRNILSLLNSVKMMVTMLACFASGNTEEVTLCSFIPVLPGYKEVCNLTILNDGLPWYCGRPSTPGLKCRHWTSSKNLQFPQQYLSVDRHSYERLPYNPRLQKTISLTAVQAGPLKGTQTDGACRRLKPRDTWEDQSPRGYWEGTKWHALNGCPLPQLNRSVFSECLHNMHFFFLGDSNARMVITKGMLPFATCTRVNGLPISKPTTYRCPDQKLELSWHPHAYPYHTGRKEWVNVRRQISPRSILDTLPPIGNYVVLIHLFLHFATQHTYIYTLHVRDTARGVRDLLKRNPRVKVFVRGPHALDNKLSDLRSIHSLRILRQEFEDLKDRVIFLNLMDMTIANENYDFHPDKYVVRAICEIIMSYMCPK